MLQSVETRAAAAAVQELRERRNWYIHQLYVREERLECLSVIEAQLRETEGTCEYALYVKGLLYRGEGRLTESLALLQAAALVAPENMANKKQLGRALFLLGRHREAMEVFSDAQALRHAKGWRSDDWELEYSIGVCHVYLRQYADAVEAFLRSLAAQRHDATFVQLAKVLLLTGEEDQAVGVLEEALAVSPENTDLLALLGHTLLRLGQPARAFDYLGRCLTYDPRHAQALMAASSIIQSGGDYDVALSKYRVAIQQLPDSPQLWNNIGACFFGKHNYYAAIACLRKSLFLFPFDWTPNYNIGIVYLALGRYTSAYHHLSAAVTMQEAEAKRSHAAGCGDDGDVGGSGNNNNKNSMVVSAEEYRKRVYPPAYMFLGVCLSLLNDIPNACLCYERAIALQAGAAAPDDGQEEDPLFHLNYAITLWNSGLAAEAAEQYGIFRALWSSLSAQRQRQLPATVPATVRVMDALVTEYRQQAKQLQQQQQQQQQNGGQGQGLGNEHHHQQQQQQHDNGGGEAAAVAMGSRGIAPPPLLSADAVNATGDAAGANTVTTPEKGIAHSSNNNYYNNHNIHNSNNAHDNSHTNRYDDEGTYGDVSDMPESSAGGGGGGSSTPGQGANKSSSTQVNAPGMGNNNTMDNTNTNNNNNNNGNNNNWNVVNSSNTFAGDNDAGAATADVDSPNLSDDASDPPEHSSPRTISRRAAREAEEEASRHHRHRHHNHDDHDEHDHDSSHSPQNVESANTERSHFHASGSGSVQPSGGSNGSTALQPHSQQQQQQQPQQQQSQQKQKTPLAVMSEAEKRAAYFSSAEI